MSEKRISICRCCTSHCPIEVTVEDGRPVRVVGDRQSAMFGGYSCAKGRSLPLLHNRPDRLLRSQKRHGDGSYRDIAFDDALDEIAERLAAIIERHGARAVGSYLGTHNAQYPTTGPLAGALLRAIGSPMQFSALTVDQPGDLVSRAFHGTWLGGEHLLEDCDAWLLVGTNPVVSHQYFADNPLGRIRMAVRNGCQLVVIDPRRTETARHAQVHLQARPGTDVAILAGFVRWFFDHDALDHHFLAGDVDGVEALREAVAPFAPDVVCARADVERRHFEEAAAVLAGARRGGAYCSTGASMSTMGGNLVYYLALAVHSLRGWWARAGDPFLRPNVLLPAVTPKAQTRGPFAAQGFGERLRVRGLVGGVAGIGAGAMFEEILTEGPGQVRALFCVGSNPLMALPDAALAARALASLELYVTTDVTLSANARAADYVIAGKMGLETPACTHTAEYLKYMCRGKGVERPYAHYAPPAADPPEGAEVVDDWELYYGLAQRLGLQLHLVSAYGLAGDFDIPPTSRPLDMARQPTTEELFELMCDGSRVPLSEVRSHPHGHLYDEARIVVEAKDAGHRARLDVGAAEMLAELAVVAGADVGADLLFVPRRDKRFVNSTGQSASALTGVPVVNPAFLAPTELARRGLHEGDIVEVRSAHGALQAVVASDESLRDGVLSMSHGFGQHPDAVADPERYGANTNLLLSTSAEFDRITGMPRMGAVPVSVHLAVLRSR